MRTALSQQPLLAIGGHALLQAHRRAEARRRRRERRQVAFRRMRPALEFVGVCLASTAAGWALVWCIEIIAEAAAVFAVWGFSF